MTDVVNHPPHYTAHPSGVECIQIVEHMGFNLGNAIKYIWRADEKGNALEDLRKAAWYVDREIQRRAAQAGIPHCPRCGGPLDREVAAAADPATPTWFSETTACQACTEVLMSG